MERIIIYLMLLSSAAALCPDPFPEELSACADFEEVGNRDETVWQHYFASGFDEDFAGKKDRFMLDSDNAFHGSFSARSMDPNGRILNDHDTDMFFVLMASSIFGRDMTYGDEVLVKYAARFPVGWQEEATDENGGANHLRLNSRTAGGIEAVFSPGWLHWYDTGADWFDGIYLKDDLWHEYSIHIRMPGTASSADGSFRVWRDNGGDYSAGRAVYSQESIRQAGDFTRIAVVTPCYYKGPVSGNWTFWLDDVEVWRGLPSDETCVHDADRSPCDGKIDTRELAAVVSSWIESAVSLADLMEAIRLWKDEVP